LLDIAPTIEEIFGERPNPHPQFQGCRLLPLLRGGRGKPGVLSRTVWWDSPVYALRDRRYKLIPDTPSGRSELYDVEADSREAHDLARSERLRVEYYRESLGLGFETSAQKWKPVGRPSPMSESCENSRALGYVSVPGCPTVG